MSGRGTGSPRQRRSVSRSMVVAIFGGVFMVYAAWQAYRMSEAMAELTPATGTIVSWQQSTDKKGRTLFYAQVRFTTKDGKIVTTRAQPGQGKAGESGKTTELIYRTDRPTDVALGQPKNVYTMPATFGGVGLLVLLYGLWGYRREKREQEGREA